MKDLQNYLKHLSIEKNYSTYTIKNYQIDITDFLEYCNKELLDYKSITYVDARGYLNYLYEQKKDKATTVSRKISSIRGFYRFISTDNNSNSSFDLLKLPKKPKRLPKFFEYNELEEMFIVPDLTTPLGQRNALILELLYATGIRVGELTNIKVNDINSHSKTIKVFGKGSKERIVYYNKITEKRLNLYLSNGRSKLNKNSIDTLFLNFRGGPLTVRGVQKVLEQIIKETSIKKHISPHMLRHSFATHLLNEGCELLTVQQLLGHESLSATNVYTHITNDRMKEVYLKTHPRSKK